MHTDGGTLEYPMSATANGDEVILSSWFTGTVQVIDRKTGKTKEMMHGFKAPHDAVRLGDGSLLVNELGPARWSASAASMARTVRRSSAASRVRWDLSRHRKTRLCHRSLFGAGVEGREQWRQDHHRS